MQVTLRCGSETLPLIFDDTRPPALAQVLDEIGYRRPGLHAGWCDETGRLRDSLPIFINGEHIRYRSGLDTILENGDEVTVIPLIAGG